MQKTEVNLKFLTLIKDKFKSKFSILSRFNMIDFMQAYSIVFALFIFRHAIRCFFTLANQYGGAFILGLIYFTMKSNFKNYVQLYSLLALIPLSDIDTAWESICLICPKEI